MTRIRSVLMMLAASFALFAAQAEAARLGGGKSVGRQSQNVTNREATPPQAPQAAPGQAAQTQPGMRPNQTPAAQPQRNRWLGPIAGLAAGLDGGLNHDAGKRGVGGQIKRDFGDRQGVTQRYQVGGFLGGHDASQSGNAQHIALFGAAFGDMGQRVGPHDDLATGDGHAGGHGFAGHIDHMGLTLVVKVGKAGHAPPSDVRGRDRMLRVAAVTSA